jgi:hypothetical protein
VSLCSGSPPYSPIPLKLKDDAPIGRTKPGRRFHQRIEHGLQVERGPANDLEDVGGRGLLLQGFAQLVEQPGILDSDRALGALRPFRFNTSRGRALAALPPALEDFVIHAKMCWLATGAARWRLVAARPLEEGGEATAKEAHAT